VLTHLIDATKPEEWDDEEDGEWVAPTVPNPKCKEAPGCGEWERPWKVNPLWRGKWAAPLIDNPAYKGEWAPRKIANPDFFEDKVPVKTLPKIGGVGIELWTMTEDILFDNIYIGHSVDDAKKFAADTFEVKKPLEVAADKPAEDEKEDDDKVSFREDPIEWIRSNLFDFIDLAKSNPVEAFQTQPEIGAVLVGLIFTLFGMIGALFGLVGGASKPVITKVCRWLYHL
jgi:hypothetical protein